MATKAIDFKLDRTYGPPRLVSVVREPDESALLRGKVTEGPLAPARVMAPPTWDGICFRKVEARKTIVTVRIPGRYVWNGETWEWRVDNQRPGMKPGESEEEYDLRIAEEAAQAGVDVADHKAAIARETGEAYPPR